MGLFRLPDVTPRPARQEQLTHRLVRRFASGSAALARGRYLTEEDIRAMREALAKWSF